MKNLSVKMPALLTLAVSISLMGCTPEEAKKTNDVTESTNRESYMAQGLVAKSLPEITQALTNGEITSEALVHLYLSRIADIDTNGPKLQAVLSLNPNALTDARESDALRQAGTTLGALHGVPILLKDNIETQDPVATTAGALALKDNITGRDSPLVAGLRSQGAIILGKTNLSQWANFRSNDSMSGWSALGGQVRNPHMLDRNPCGSSSGSGAATAASLASASVGTETNGSVICPSNANGIVGFKPTVGLVPQDYIIPISATQDTAGPMTKTVMGAAMMMNAMTPANDVNYRALLSEKALKGVRIGVLRFSQGNNSNIIKRFNDALKDMQAAGAILVDIDKSPLEGVSIGDKAYDLLKYEFKAGLNAYLASTPESVKVRTLEELIAFNQEHAGVELALFDQSILVESQAMKGLDDPDYISSRDTVLKANRQDGIDALLSQYNVDVLVSPSGPVVPRVDPVNGDVWPSFPGAGGIAARAGYPHASVPMGEIRGLSVNVSFIGGKTEDAKILSYAYAYEQKSQKRIEPHYYNGAKDIADIAKAMTHLDRQ